MSKLPPDFPGPKQHQQTAKMKVTPVTIKQAVSLATKDLTSRLGHSNFSLATANTVTWPDSSAGCTSPDNSYLQVLTPGYLIVFNAGTKVFVYTGSRGSPPKWCPASSFRPPYKAHPDA